MGKVYICMFPKGRAEKYIMNFCPQKRFLDPCAHFPPPYMGDIYFFEGLLIVSILSLENLLISQKGKCKTTM